MTETTKETKPVEKPKPRERNDGIVFIGDKPFMAYVTGVVMQLQQRPKVIIKARGKFISRAVDVSQMVTKRFVDNAKVTDIKVDSEEFENKEKRQVRVSNIELTVTKTK